MGSIFHLEHVPYQRQAGRFKGINQNFCGSRLWKLQWTALQNGPLWIFLEEFVVTCLLLQGPGCGWQQEGDNQMNEQKWIYSGMEATKLFQGHVTSGTGCCLRLIFMPTHKERLFQLIFMEKSYSHFNYAQHTMPASLIIIATLTCFVLWCRCLLS